MLHLLATLKRKLKNIRKGSRVGDENMPTFVHDMNGTRQLPRWNGLSVLYRVVTEPLSCFCHSHANGADGLWVSGEYGQMSADINYLMVNDSMRYAILM
ncbi:hypothetical protein HHK36_023954 [Tetracentron sinense]|uniref:Uncharacterized protein n=1 Tax=Tetracentron sinense TaxID=13715 RepID=A0A834YNM9_TETSI|nr:hypothetical protein HHK36_023954 [Tetracentron sinense]